MKPSWLENEAALEPVNIKPYQHEDVNLEESRILIDTILAEEFVDPFKEMFRSAILTQLQFREFMKNSATCDLVSTVPTVVVKRTIPFKDTQFDVLKCIGHGAYGRVYR